MLYALIKMEHRAIASKEKYSSMAREIPETETDYIKKKVVTSPTMVKNEL